MQHYDDFYYRDAYASPPINNNIEIQYDNALNAAAWVLLEELQKYGELSGRQFNNLKSCLKLAIEKYLTDRCDNGNG